MTSYYELILFLLLFLQEEFEGFVATLFCFVMTITNHYIAPLLITSLGINFFEAMLIVDFVFFCLSFFIIFCKLGWWIMFTMLFSFILNLIPLVFDVSDYYDYFKAMYPILNHILFEIIVGVCFVTTWVYPKMREYSENWSKEKWGS